MDTVTVADEGAVRIATMSRPEALNAFNGQLINDLTQAFLDAREAAGVKVLILTGQGRAFSAGADLRESAPADRTMHGFTDMLNAIIDFPKPFIAAVNGVGVGIGTTILGLADLVFMAREARLRTPFSSLGLTAEAASTVTFPALMGRQRANWLLLGAEWMSAEDCERAGLVLETVPGDELMSLVMARANKLAALPLSSLMKTKELMMEPLRPQLRAAIAAENEGLAEMRSLPAYREAVTAFREKRDPDFSGM